MTPLTQGIWNSSIHMGREKNDDFQGMGIGGNGEIFNRYKISFKQDG